MREIVSPLSGIRSPFGGRVDPYKVLGFRPTLVADMTRDYYRNTSRQSFDDLFTHSRLGNATMVDSDGLLKWAPHNLLTYSEDFSNAVWSTGGSRSTNTTIAPDGTLTADTLTHSAQYQSLLQAVSLPAGVEHTIRYWVKAGTATNPLYFGHFDGVWRTGDSVTPNAEWQLATYTFTPSAAVTNILIAQDRSSSAFGSVYIWGAHLYRSDLGGMAPVPLDARVAGSTTYVPTTSTAKYLPRRHNHVYNGSAWVDAGTLIETEARTNLITYSVPVNAQWTTAQATITENAATAPDGTATASEITEDSTASAFHFARPAFITMGAAPHTVSCYLKAGTATTASLFLAQSGNAGAVFDLSAGTVSSVSGTGNTAAIEDAGNGWYRCIVTNDGGADILDQVRVGVDNGALASSSGDGVSSIYAWGLQVEAASTPSSYCPTNGAASTRAADTNGLTIPAANLPWPTPRVIGEELVAGGEFNDAGDLDDWTLAGGTATVTANVVRLTNVSSRATLSQAFPTTLGGIYYVDLGLIDNGNSGPNAATIRVTSNNSYGGTILASANSSLSGGNLTFVATGTTTYIWLANNTATAGQFVDFGPVSVREINPLAVSIQMDGRQTGDNSTMVRWYADANNYITQESGASDYTFEQAEGGTVDGVTGGSFTSGVNVPFNIASRHGSTFVNGAVGGAALTADTTPTALPDLSSTDLQIGYDFMGNIEQVRIWTVDIGDTGIAEASS